MLSSRSSLLLLGLWCIISMMMDDGKFLCQAFIVRPPIHHHHQQHHHPINVDVDSRRISSSAYIDGRLKSSPSVLIMQVGSSAWSHYKKVPPHRHHHDLAAMELHICKAWSSPPCLSTYLSTHTHRRRRKDGRLPRMNSRALSSKLPPSYLSPSPSTIIIIINIVYFYYLMVRTHTIHTPPHHIFPQHTPMPTYLPTYSLDDITRKPTFLKIEANEVEREALAERFEFETLKSLSATVSVSRPGWG